jgi:hypothetical protein
MERLGASKRFLIRNSLHTHSSGSIYLSLRVVQYSRDEVSEQAEPSAPPPPVGEVSAK